MAAYGESSGAKAARSSNSSTSSTPSCSLLRWSTPLCGHFSSSGKAHAAMKTIALTVRPMRAAWWRGAEGKGGMCRIRGGECDLSGLRGLGTWAARQGVRMRARPWRAENVGGGGLLVDWAHLELRGGGEGAENTENAEDSHLEGEETVRAEGLLGVLGRRNARIVCLGG